ncbi:MAG: response regulator transcription factor [Deltaproteobacteria bacterium]|nr:MAG: response regulator transcription factor [Deltaproteobacteria bacterium]TMQ25650.1 MAG: response regulator transcription factor [Deltaproteobacteria bacterium]
MNRHRVLLAEDHTLVRAGLRALLDNMANVEVVGEAEHGGEALKLVAQLRPEVVVMDLSMPILNGIEATRRVVKLKPRPRVLVLSMHDDAEYVRQALGAGASGYLLKSAAVSELELALAAVIRGEVWISPAIARSVVDEIARREPAHRDALTPRQREILQLVAEGHTTKQIAKRLHIGMKTVDAHRAQIMERLDIHNIAGLVRYAIRMGVIPSR